MIEWSRKDRGVFGGLATQLPDPGAAAVVIRTTDCFAGVGIERAASGLGYDDRIDLLDIDLWDERNE
jgi:hypothetical protein